MADEATQELLDVLTHVLTHSTDPHVLMLAARSLARHPDPEALLLLTSFLRNRELLGRLDEVTSPPNSMLRLFRVFDVLQARADDAVRELCLKLAGDPGFMSIDERNLLLLRTLADVQPMDDATVAYFEQTNQSDYTPINGPLLLHNASPKALALYERMIADPEVEPIDHVDSLRTGVLPKRTEPAVVEMCARLLDAKLPDEVYKGIVESLYDHRSREWFGPAIEPPSPPPWESAPRDVLQALIALAPRARVAPGVSDTLARAVLTTEQELVDLLKRGRL